MQLCKHNQDGRCSSRETRRWEITSGVLQGQTPDPRDSKHYIFHYKERWFFSFPSILQVLKSCIWLILRPKDGCQEWLVKRGEKKSPKPKTTTNSSKKKQTNKHKKLVFPCSFQGEKKPMACCHNGQGLNFFLIWDVKHTRPCWWTFQYANVPATSTQVKPKTIPEAWGLGVLDPQHFQ